MYWPVKKILDDIIEETYKEDSEQRKKFFKWFEIDLATKKNNTYSGRYFPDKKKIEVISLDTDNSQIIITCIHELAHHIDQCKHGSTGHQTPFYEEYTKLLYTAMNMHLFSPEDFVKRETRDFNKVKKILENWKPEYIDYKSDLVKIKANIPFDKKDEAKKHNYKWNSVEKVWEIEVPEEKISEEEGFLRLIGCINYTVNNASEFKMNAIGYIMADKGSYDYRDTLKENGFFYSNKTWYKKINAQEYEKTVNELSILTDGKVEFRLTNKIK